jgi:hypothetical protein
MGACHGAFTAISAAMAGAAARNAAVHVTRAIFAMAARPMVLKR